MRPWYMAPPRTRRRTASAWTLRRPSLRRTLPQSRACHWIALDPEAAASAGLGEGATGTSTYDLLDGAPLGELVNPTRFPNLHLVPAKPELAGATVELTRHGDGETYLRQALASGAERYSFVFLDCPPS